MESKKADHAELTNKSAFFFSIGLFITMVALVFVFEYKTYEEAIDIGIKRNTDLMEEILEVPPTEHLPPPPVVQIPQIVEVPDEEKIEEEIKVNLDVEATDETKVEQIEIKHEKEEEEEVDQILTIVEELASPVGGKSAFYKHVQETLKYPAMARKMGVEGRVYCSFVVNRDGTIEDVKVMRGIGADCDEEAVRVIKASPPWNPAKQRGKPVRSRFHFYINFSLH